MANITKEQIAALAAAQQKVDEAQHDQWVSTVASICLVPGEVQSHELGSWREREMTPANQALASAVAERDRCLASTGLSLDEWLGHWEGVKAQLQAAAS